MFDRDLISFCIPTYNRSEILNECLNDLIPKIKDYGFEIIVSDNHSSDNTQEIVEQHKLVYSHLKYVRQKSVIDPDMHFADVLSYSTSKYTWLLGDSYRVNGQVLSELLTIINSKKYLLILVNFANSITGIKSRVYNDLSDILNDLGWYLPFMSAYIYSKDMLMNANYKKFYYSNFLQMGIVFEYCENKDFDIYWYAENATTITLIPKTSWQNQALKVFAKNWTEFILSLPRSIDLSIKLKCLKEHGKYHHLFTLKNLLKFREMNGLKYKDCVKYKIYFKYISIYPWIIVAGLSFFPIKILKFIKRIFLKKKLSP